MVMAKDLKVRIDRLEKMGAAHIDVLSETPEEEAWAKPKGLLEKGARAFGRNTYPTDNPEPHGYEFFLTVGLNIEPDGDIDMRLGSLEITERAFSIQTVSFPYITTFLSFREGPAIVNAFRKLKTRPDLLLIAPASIIRAVPAWPRILA